MFLKANVVLCVCTFCRGCITAEPCPIIRKTPKVIWKQENKAMESNVLRRAEIESLIRMASIILDF